jgi:chaperonin GroEL (HSP60 family)
MEETERSLHDAIMIVRRASKNDAVVAGGGAIEMELSKYLRDCSRYYLAQTSSFKSLYRDDPSPQI